MKEKVYQISVKSATLYGSETWRLREKEELLGTERAIIRVMCEVTLIDRKTKELRQMLDITASIERMVRAAAVRWYKTSFAKRGR